MLSTFCSLVIGLIVAWVAYHLPDIVFELWIARKIYNVSMTFAEEYLAENGRGFFEDKNQSAVSIEWTVRVFLTFVFQLTFVILGLWLIPRDYRLWVITGTTIKVGIIVGFIVNLVMNMIIEVLHSSHIGRLLSISEEGLGHFQGTYCDDFDVDLSAWEPEERPPLDRRYLVLDILGETGVSMLDLA